jgi:uncharacterized protein (TIGR02145 family)
MKRLASLCCMILLLSFSFSCKDNPTDSEKTGIIIGKVTDSNKGSSISSANISTDPVTNTVTTNSTGDYEISGVNPGSYSVSASKTGYFTNSVEISVTAGNTTTADIALSSVSPTASFTVDPLTGNSSTTFYFDASECNDNQDPLSALLVRWDWENDGSWNTGYSTNKTITHQYSTEGTYTIKMEVKNASDLTDDTTSQVSVYSYGTGTLTDIDGNTYITVRIGNHWWMAENLKVIHYSNGDAIPNVIGDSDWGNLNTGAYCNYQNDESNVETYGRLYNWHAVGDSRNLAPDGWHVPTDEEWKELERYLGMNQTEVDIEDDWRGTDEGGKIKEAGTKHWYSPNTGATNESGFSALPAGDRAGLTGVYSNLVGSAGFWSSTVAYGSNGWCRVLSNDNSQIFRSGTINCYQRHGYSVRCIKD